MLAATIIEATFIFCGALMPAHSITYAQDVAIKIERMDGFQGRVRETEIPVDQDPAIQAWMATLRPSLTSLAVLQVEYFRSIRPDDQPLARCIIDAVQKELPPLLRSVVVSQLRGGGMHARGGAGWFVVGNASTSSRDPSEVLHAQILQILPPTIRPVADAELAARMEFRCVTTCQQLVAAIDAQLSLSSRQREHLYAAIHEHYDERWFVVTTFPMRDHHLPPVPDKLIMPHLTLAQQELWQRRPRHGSIVADREPGALGNMLEVGEFLGDIPWEAAAEDALRNLVATPDPAKTAGPEPDAGATK